MTEVELLVAYGARPVSMDELAQLRYLAAAVEMYLQHTDKRSHTPEDLAERKALRERIKKLVNEHREQRRAAFERD